MPQNNASSPKAPLLSLTPILIFLSIFLGSGIYFTVQEVPNAFYQISPAVAILPALIMGVVLAKGPLNEKIDTLVDGMRHKDILMMCLIFLLAGAFGVVTKGIGCVDDLVYFVLHFLPKSALLPGLFLLAAFISLAVGSSMGVVAAITPISLGFVEEVHLSLPLTLGTVIGGAMFGDNLSMISDTTIAAVHSQKADMLKKFKLNALLAGIAGALTIALLIMTFTPKEITALPQKAYSTLKLLPYGLIILLALLRVNVFIVLTLGIIAAGVIGILDRSEYDLITFTQNIYSGFSSMHEIMVLSLLVGAMSGLMQQQGGLDYIAHTMNQLINQGKRAPQKAEFAIAGMVALKDVCIANNTIAIILTGPIARKIAQKNHVAPERTACWLSIFSCVVQGVLPYSAQILLAASLAKTNPLSLVGHVYYCYILGAVTLLYMLKKPPANASADGA